MGSVEPVIAFAARTFEPPGMEIRVNFGVFAGREATPAEIDELAEALRAKAEELSIISEDRHEFSDHSEAELHRSGGRRSASRSATPSSATSRGLM